MGHGWTHSRYRQGGRSLLGLQGPALGQDEEPLIPHIQHPQSVPAPCPCWLFSFSLSSFFISLLTGRPTLDPTGWSISSFLQVAAHDLPSVPHHQICLPLEKGSNKPMSP